MPLKTRFSGRSAFVTGAGGGMGLAIARGLADAGCAVTGFDLKPRPDRLGEGDAPVSYVRGDLTDEAAVGRAVDGLFSRHGRLDYLVNAAGVLLFGEDRSAAEIDLALWDRVMAVNLKSVVHTCRHAIPRMRQGGGGAMVHIATIQCLRGDPAPQDAYQASKAGVTALSKSLAVQLAGDGIRSNVIHPGPTLSPMQQRWQEDPRAAAQVAEQIPLGRLGTPADISHAALFLLSDEASFITGAELIVDGGLMALP